jgi:hypothetical protein
VIEFAFKKCFQARFVSEMANTLACSLIQSNTIKSESWD